jgi:hypothetical protein
MGFSKVAIALILAFTALILTENPTGASEGLIELRSTTGEDYRCHASSYNIGGVFRIPTSCRDLIYPAGPNIFTYVVWANPRAGGNPVKLGSLGFGTAEFKTKTAFTDLFVTTESSGKVKTPTGRVVMRGSVQQITFLERPTTPTPVPEGEEMEEKVEMQKLSTRERLILGLRRAGLAVLLALVTVIGLVFVLTRARR